MRKGERQAATPPHNGASPRSAAWHTTVLDVGHLVEPLHQVLEKDAGGGKAAVGRQEGVDVGLVGVTQAPNQRSQRSALSISNEEGAQNDAKKKGGNGGLMVG